MNQRFINKYFRKLKFSITSAYRIAGAKYNVLREFLI